MGSVPATTPPSHLSPKVFSIFSIFASSSSFFFLPFSTCSLSDTGGASTYRPPHGASLPSQMATTVGFCSFSRSGIHSIAGSMMMGCFSSGRPSSPLSLKKRHSRSTHTRPSAQPRNYDYNHGSMRHRRGRLSLFNSRPCHTVSPLVEVIFCGQYRRGCCPTLWRDESVLGKRCYTSITTLVRLRVAEELQEDLSLAYAWLVRLELYQIAHTVERMWFWASSWFRLRSMLLLSAEDGARYVVLGSPSVLQRRSCVGRRHKEVLPEYRGRLVGR